MQNLKPAISMLFVSLFLRSQDTPDLNSPKLAFNATLAINDQGARSVSDWLEFASTSTDAQGHPAKTMQIIKTPGLKAAPAPSDPILTPSDILQRSACRSDAIVIGKVETKRYHLSAHKMMVYGDFLIDVRKAIRDPQLHFTSAASKLIFTIPGGTLIVPEGRISFDIAEFPLLLPDKEYLFLLRYVPESDSYEPFNEEAILAKTADRWRFVNPSVASWEVLDLGGERISDTFSTWSLCR